MRQASRALAGRAGTKLQDEVRTVLRGFLSGWRRKGPLLLTMAWVSTFVIVVLDVGRGWKRATHAIDVVSAVRHTHSMLEVVLRTPMSLFAPAPSLPMWGAVSQVLIVVALAEVFLGRALTAVIALSTQLLVNVVAQLVFWAHHASWIGLTAGHLSDRDTGPSVAVAALACAVAVKLRSSMLGGALFVAMIIEVLIRPDMAGHEHVIAMAVGPGLLGVATVLERRRAQRRALASKAATATPTPTAEALAPLPDETPEQAAIARRHTRRTRRLAATATAGSGLVALVSALTAPMSDRARDVGELLSFGATRAATGIVAAAGVALLVLAAGVLRGQRRAWQLAVCLLAVVVVGHLVKGGDVEESTLAAIVLVALLWRWRDFDARTGLQTARHAVRTVIAGSVVAFAAGFLAVEAISAAGPTHRRLRVGRAARGVVRSVTAGKPADLPIDHSGYLHAALFGMAAATAVLALWRALRPVIYAEVNERAREESADRARAIVGRHGGGTLDYFALRDDKSHFFWGDTVVSYRAAKGVCVVSPDPIGPAEERSPAWAAFHHFADRQGWVVAVLGAGHDRLAAYRRFGMREIYLGDEAIVDVDTFGLDGGERKSLRQAVNRVARNGYRVTFHDPVSVDDELRTKLVTLMGASRRGGVERGFSMTLGRIFDPKDTGLLLAVCHGPDGEPAAFCQYVPSAEIGGWSLDLMRRDTGEHPNGLLDYVIVETIRHIHATGGRALGLNFAAMRGVLAEERGTGRTQRVQRYALRRLSSEMQIASLWHFNAKYGPRWVPRYAVVDGIEHGPSAAIAMAKVESLWDLPVLGRLFAH